MYKSTVFERKPLTYSFIVVYLQLQLYFTGGSLKHRTLCKVNGVLVNLLVYMRLQTQL